MRDVKRIPKTLKRLEKIWERNPDLRFGQLVANVFHQDPYYVEDDDFVKALEDYYKEIKDERT